MKVELAHEYDPDGLPAERRYIAELRKSAKKVQKIFRQIKMPGKEYVKLIQVTPIASSVQIGGSVAIAYPKYGTIVIGIYNPYGELISDEQLMKNVRHEIAHLYYYHNPTKIKEESFALRAEVELRGLLR